MVVEHRCGDVESGSGSKMTNRVFGVHRLDLHNVSVDDELAVKLGCCGQIHLATGRRCTLPQHHAGSCRFVSCDEVDRLKATADVRAPEG